MKDYTKETLNFYNSHAEKFAKNTKDMQDSEWLNSFMDMMKREARILDLGCAFGRDTKYFIDKGFDAYGTDISGKLIEIAKKNVPKAKFFISDLMALPFKDNFFDGIWCSATLLHIAKKDIPSALAEINRILKPNGVVFFNVKKGIGEGIIKDGRYNGAKKYYSYFEKEEMLRFLFNAGFNMVKCEIKHYTDKYRNFDMIFLLTRKRSL